MKNKNLLDQFLLVDDEKIKGLVEAASLNKNDRVLEIGAGTGVVTREIAKKAGKVFAVEVDKKFASFLKGMPDNVEIIFGNALAVLGQVKFNKVISSLPSSLVEPIMQRFKKVDFDLLTLLVPLKFVKKLVEDNNFSDYFETELIAKVKKESFAPQPKTNWALVKMTRKDDPIKTKDYERFIRQYLYEHPKATKKNALMEVVIKVYRSLGRVITKNQARQKIAENKNKSGLTETISEIVKRSTGLRP